MNMITESTIEQVIELFESDAVDYEKSMQQFAGQQPAIMSFLLADNEGALLEDERDYLLYLSAIIWKAISVSNPGLPSVSAVEVAEAEEMNWAMLEETSARKFRERLDVFFEDYEQEDLLAFAEDALTGDNDEDDPNSFQLTPEGREPMFVALKTVIDVLTAEDVV